MGLSSLRYAFRSLVATPSATLLVILTLAIGIGATTAIVSVVDAVLLARLPFREPDRLVVVWEHKRDHPEGSHGTARNVAGPANYIRWRERARSFEGLAFLAGGHGTLSVPMSMTVSGIGEPDRVPAALVSGDLFKVLGVSPLTGRFLDERDAVQGAAGVAVVSERWARRHQLPVGSLPGRTITVDGASATVVGVAPASLDLPHGADLWMPLAEEGFREARGRWMGVIGRLAPGVSVDSARQEMSTIASALARETPASNTGWGTTVVPLADQLVAVVRPGLTAVTVAAFCVLAVACLNIVNLLLARALAGHRNSAIRLALGAQSGRLVAQAVLEGVALAAAGGLVGTLLAAWVLQAYEPTLQTLLGTSASLSLNGRVLAIGFALAAAGGVVFGALPAWLMTRRMRVGALNDGRTISAGRDTGKLRSALVVSEIALAFVLLLGAGALVRSYWLLSRVDPGFEATRVLTSRVAPAGPSYEAEGTATSYITRLTDRIARLGEVEHVGAISFRPLGPGAATSYQIVGRHTTVGDEPVADVRAITPGLLEALNIARREGRLFTAEDTAQSTPVAIVNEAFVHDLPEGVAAIGQAVDLAWGQGGTQVSIVGVVADVRLRSLDAAPRPTVYLPLTQSPYSAMTLAVRARNSAAELGPILRGLAAEIDPQVPMTDIEPLDQAVSASIGRPRVLLGVLGAFAGVALLLSLIGLYGVMAHNVQQRIREIGVRIAVGASPSHVVGLITRQGLKLLVLGCLAGGALAMLANDLSIRLIGDTADATVATTAAVVAAFVAVGLAATIVPAWRAARVDPLVVLRED